MNKKVLAVYFSQTGQTRQILDSFLKPIIADGNEVEYLRIDTVKKYPFPWSLDTFFNVMPECVSMTPSALEPWQTKQTQYDLVVLAWQPWFLSPSIPINSLLQSEQFKAIIKDTPVITISGCRNMWINGIEKIKKLLLDARAKLVGNIALVDKHQNHVSFITIFYWMGTGKKDRMWGLFPKPGVSQYDIDHAELFGRTAAAVLATGNWESLQPQLIQQKAVDVKYDLMFIERKAGKIFKIWQGIIDRHPKYRKQLISAYKYYLVIALLVAAPIILFVDLIFFRFRSPEKIQRQINYYSGITFNPQIHSIY